MKCLVCDFEILGYQEKVLSPTSGTIHKMCDSIDKARGDSEKSLNHNEGKPRLGLVIQDMSNAIEAMARVREMGSKKYTRLNWAVSMGKPEEKEFLEDNLESIYRHLSDLKNSDLDDESKCYHMAHVAVRACFALEYAIRGESGLDER